MPIRFDTFAALLILVGALVVSAVAYQKLLEVEHPNQIALQAVPVGNHKHFVVHGTKCVGMFETEFKVTPETTIISKGEMRFSLQDRIITARSFVGAFFNVLDQLVATNITLEVDEGKIAVKTTNPSPILVEGTLHLRGETTNHQLELPGPILLKNNGNGTYRIDYSALTSISRSYNPALVDNALGGMDLKVVSRADDGRICRGEGDADRLDDAIVLDPLVAQAQTLLSRMRQSPFFLSGGK